MRTDLPVAMEALMQLRDQVLKRIFTTMFEEWMVFRTAEERGTIPPLEVLRKINREGRA